MSVPRVVRVLGHPLHAILSDFPLALVCPSIFWDAIGVWRHEPLWWAISFWTIALGLASALVTAAAGLADYAAIPEKDPAASTATCHMAVMLTAVCLYAASLIVRRTAAPPEGAKLMAAFLLEGFGFLSLGAGGWLAGISFFITA